MNSDRTQTLSGHFPRIAYRAFSWVVTGLTVVLFLLLVASAFLSGPDASTADTSVLWTAYQAAYGLAFSLVLYLVTPIIPVVIVFWAMSDESPSDDGERVSIPLSVRVGALAVLTVLTRYQRSVSLSDAVSGVSVEQVAVVLVGLCIAVVVIPLTVFRFLDGRDDSEETGCSESPSSENRTVTEAR